MRVDASGKILGRLASRVAEEAREKEVEVVNSEKAVVSGPEEKVLQDYRTKYERGARDRGPYFPRRPDRILHRTITGMLPEEEEKNVQTLIGDPKEAETDEIDVKTGEETRNRDYVELGKISRSLGWER